MPELLTKVFAGNFSSPLTLTFVIFSLLAFYFVLRLGWIFFAKGDEFLETVEGKRQTRNLVRLLVASVLIALFSGFIFQFVLAGRDAMAASAPGAAKSFFDWLVGK